MANCLPIYRHLARSLFFKCFLMKNIAVLVHSGHIRRDDNCAVCYTALWRDARRVVARVTKNGKSHFFTGDMTTDLDKFSRGTIQRGWAGEKVFTRVVHSLD
jgi:hypothetical protein